MTRAEHEWDGRSPEVTGDQIAAYDAMRARCPVAHSADGSWTVFTHAETVTVLDDHDTFSNVVSRHVAVPNGMDGEEHRAHRAVVDRYFLPDRIAEFAPACRSIARKVVAELRRPGTTEVMATLARPYAARVTCAFMGWPASFQEPLAEWMRANHAATLTQDGADLAAVARAFDGHIRGQLDQRRGPGGAAADVTSRLLRERVDGRPLTDEQIVSIVRNWTVGELGTIAAGVGIVIDALIRNPAIQTRLRTHADDDRLLDAFTDEALRINAPLIANRRRTTRPVTLAAREIPEGARVKVLWASANRDEAVFGDPDTLRLDRRDGENLLYGRGVHVCPGAGLARLELRTIVAELLTETHTIAPAPGTERTHARYPVGGFSRLSVRIT